MSNCKEMVHSGGRSVSFHQCSRKAVKDGYCRIHHPEAVKARQEKADERYREKLDNSIYGQAARLRAEVDAWRTRFPGYRYLDGEIQTVPLEKAE